MNRPKRVRPKAIRKTPDSSAAVKPDAKPCSATTGAKTIATRMLGPEMSPRVLPVIAANRPRAIAPYKPDAGPTPAITPKAIAVGTKTTPTNTPAKRSVVMLLIVEWIFRLGQESAVRPRGRGLYPIWPIIPSDAASGPSPHHQLAGQTVGVGRRTRSELPESLRMVVPVTVPESSLQARKR